MDRMEYVAVSLKVGGIGNDEKRITERLNAVADEGWQLVTPLAGKNGETTYVVFGRYLDE